MPRRGYNRRMTETPQSEPPPVGDSETPPAAEVHDADVEERLDEDPDRVPNAPNRDPSTPPGPGPAPSG